jgi:tRNA-uridine 2-sulfurtransferase
MSMKKKVVVAMSGGVDSAVAAALLQKEGYECIGVFMRLGGDPSDNLDADVDLVACSSQKSLTQSATPSTSKGCCSSSDAADARYVAGLLNMPFYALNFQHDFGGIIDYFVREYNAGRTPNPCVRCNEYLKFGKLARYARAVGADYVATGHYARVAQLDGKTCLMRGRDHAKDQSYVLFGVPAQELERMLLPIGELKKTEVRQMAQELGLPVFNKPDSQEICFVPDQDYARLVRKKTPEAMRPGPLVTPQGAPLGTHAGHQQFTIGQRRGLGVALGHPVYVTAIDAVTNTVTLGKKEDLLRRGLIAREVNWIAPPPPTEHPIRCTAKIRYNSPPAAATVMLTGPDHLTVRFDEPVSAITPGQAVVCYDGERLLGGGWIDEVSP